MQCAVKPDATDDGAEVKEVEEAKEIKEVKKVKEVRDMKEVRHVKEVKEVKEVRSEHLHIMERVERRRSSCSAEIITSPSPRPARFISATWYTTHCTI